MQFRIVIGILSLSLISCGESRLTSVEQPTERPTPPTRTFIEADFYWDDTLTPHKDIIIRGVNMVYRDNKNCNIIDPSSAYISSNQGTDSDPVFFVTCGSGPNVFNSFFSKSEVEKGAPMRAIENISRLGAIEGCEQYAKLNATNPSTVSFSRVMDLTVIERPNGRTSVNSTFTASNAFGVDLKFDIQCLYDGATFLEGVINESM